MLLENTEFQTQEKIYGEIKPTDYNTDLPRENLEEEPKNFQGSSFKQVHKIHLFFR